MKSNLDGVAAGTTLNPIIGSSGPTDDNPWRDLGSGSNVGVSSAGASIHLYAGRRLCRSSGLPAFGVGSVSVVAGCDGGEQPFRLGCCAYSTCIIVGNIWVCVGHPPTVVSESWTLEVCVEKETSSQVMWIYILMLLYCQQLAHDFFFTLCVVIFVFFPDAPALPVAGTGRVILIHLLLREIRMLHPTGSTP